MTVCVSAVAPDKKDALSVSGRKMSKSGNGFYISQSNIKGEQVRLGGFSFGKRIISISLHMWGGGGEGGRGDGAVGSRQGRSPW